MFTRVTAAAQSVMEQAYECAVRDRVGEIGEDHLLEALLADPQGAVLLGGRSVGEDVVRNVRGELEDRRRKGGLTAAEEGALAGLGINLDAVVDRIEDQLGTGALAGSDPKRNRWWRRPDFSADVIRILADAERQLAATGERSLGIEHMVLAMVSVPGFTSESLARHGVSEANVRTALVAKQAGGDRR